MTTTSKGCLLRKDDGVPWSHSASRVGRWRDYLQVSLVPERSDVGGAEGAWEGFCSGKLVFDEFLRENAKCFSYRTPFLSVSLGRQTARASNPAGWQDRFLKSSSCSASLWSPFLFFPYRCRVSTQEIQCLLKAGSAELNFSAVSWWSPSPW